MGGEKRQHQAAHPDTPGSPPHGRGKGRKSTRAKLGIRITPAWAGKRACCPSLSDRRQDHPRMGGEKLYEQMEQGAGRGSPPHGRGKVCRCCCGRTAAGITPAWAGKSSSRKSVEAMARDYPRMGGEKHSGSCRTLTRSGSPPHGRGKVCALGAGCLAHGITPAWAGKSSKHCRWRSETRDHPRMGGEKISWFNTGCSPKGSPPHGRGKGALPPGALGKVRITPAWAGKSRECQ